MPEKDTLAQAQEDLREGKSPSTAAGEFVREEMDHIREGKHGARSAKQAIAIGLSKARRAGVPLAPPKIGRVTETVRKQAARETAKAQSTKTNSAVKSGKIPKLKIQPVNPTRSKATDAALKREPHAAASHRALSVQTRAAARKRTPKERHDAAVKAVATKGEDCLHDAGVKAAKTRAKSEA